MRKSLSIFFIVNFQEIYPYKTKDRDVGLPVIRKCLRPVLNSHHRILGYHHSQESEYTNLREVVKSFRNRSTGLTARDSPVNDNNLGNAHHRETQKRS